MALLPLAFLPLEYERRHKPTRITLPAKVTARLAKLNRTAEPITKHHLRSESVDRGYVVMRFQMREAGPHEPGLNLVVRHS